VGPNNYVLDWVQIPHDKAELCDVNRRNRPMGHVGRVHSREREKNLFTTKQIISVTIKMNLCGRLPGRKFPSSWPPILIQIYIILYIAQRNQTMKPDQSNI